MMTRKNKERKMLRQKDSTMSTMRMVRHTALFFKKKHAGEIMTLLVFV